MEYVSMVLSMIAIALCLIDHFRKPKTDAKGFTGVEEDQIRQVLSVMNWDGDMHEDKEKA